MMLDEMSPVIVLLVFCDVAQTVYVANVSRLQRRTLAHFFRFHHCRRHRLFSRGFKTSALGLVISV